MLNFLFVLQSFNVLKEIHFFFCGCLTLIDPFGFNCVASRKKKARLKKSSGFILPISFITLGVYNFIPRQNNLLTDSRNVSGTCKACVRLACLLCCYRLVHSSVWKLRWADGKQTLWTQIKQTMNGQWHLVWCFHWNFAFVQLVTTRGQSKPILSATLCSFFFFCNQNSRLLHWRRLLTD